MHSIVASRGVVLSKRTHGEASAVVFILTQELGLVRASARSARLERSKLRYGLEPLTRGRFSLVRGKYEWKLTGAHELERPYARAPLNARKAAGRVARLLLRLMHGEEPARETFEAAYEGFERMASADQADIEAIEWVLVLRLLSSLGYVEERASSKPFIETRGFSEETLALARAKKTALIAAINESIGMTGL